MFYTRKKRFDVYRDYFKEEEPFSDFFTPDVSPKKPHQSTVSAVEKDQKCHEPHQVGAEAEVEDDAEDNGTIPMNDASTYSEPMDMFSMNNVSAMVKYLSPAKGQSMTRPDNNIPFLNFSRASILATPRNPKSIPLAAQHPQHTTTIQSHSSLHLSEFEQPPQGTSTPAPGTYLDGIHTPTRPAGYPEPRFRFVSEDLSFDSDASMISGEGMSSLPRTASSPLTNKLRISELKEEISSIVDRMKTSVLIHAVDGDNDTYMDAGNRRSMEYSEEVDFSLPDVSGLSMVPLSEVSTSTPKSIMRKHEIKDKNEDAAYSKRKPYKKLRFNETVEVIADSSMKMKQIERMKKRPLSSQMGMNNRKKTKHTKDRSHFSNYEDLIQRCKGEKDPLNILG